MEGIKVTEKEEAILNETIQFYSEDIKRRASFANLGSFYYYEGKMCALGRYLIDPHKFRIYVANLHVSEELTEEMLDEWIKENGKGCRVKFWKRLQVLHDNGLYWKKGGLSARGKRYVQDMFYV